MPCNVMHVCIVVLAGVCGYTYKYIYIYMYNLKVFVKIRNIDFCERVIFRNPKGKFVVGKFCDGLISCIQQGSRKR